MTFSTTPSLRTEKLDTNEAFEKFNLNRQMEKFPLGYLNEHGAYETLGDVFGMRDKETLEPLFGVSVGGRYEVLQFDSNKDIINHLVKESMAEYVKGGWTRDNRSAYVQIRLPDSIRVRDSDDVVNKLLTFRNSYDGSSNFVILPTLWRQICSNGMHAWVDQKNQALKIRHTVNAHDRIQMADRLLLEAMNAYNTIEVKINQYAVTPFSDKQMNELSRKLFNVKDDVQDVDIPTRTLNNINNVKELFETGVGLEGWRGTSWAAVNAITEHFDHHRKMRANTDRFESNLFGTSATNKQRGIALLDRMIAA